MCVNQLNNRHRAHEKEENSRQVAQMMREFLRNNTSIGREQNIDRPAQHPREQSAGRLVDLELVLKRDDRIAQDEY